MSLHSSINPINLQLQTITLDTSPSKLHTQHRVSVRSPLGLHPPMSPMSPISPLPPCSPVQQSTIKEWSKTRASIAQSITDQAKYQLHTMLLFTYSDLKTLVGPQTFFGILHALSASAFDIASDKSAIEIMCRAPLVILWTWINLLPFCMNNQRQPDSIIEDAANKPWRPIAAQRLTPATAKKLMFVFYAVAFLVSVLTGGLTQNLTLIVLGYMYNNLGGADSSLLARNLLNGLGIVSFGSGTMEVALGSSFRSTPSLMRWLLILVLVITATVHILDMSDQEGDRLRDRLTLPLCIGDMATRYTIAVAVLACTWMSSHFWNSRPAAYATPVLLATIIAVRILTKRAVDADKKTSKLWSLWIVSLYTLPLISLS